MKIHVIILAILLIPFVATYAGPIKGLVDTGTGQEIADADARYVLVSSTNESVLPFFFVNVTNDVYNYASIGWFSHEAILTNVVARGEGSTYVFDIFTNYYMASMKDWGLIATGLVYTAGSGATNIDLGSIVVPKYWRVGIVITNISATLTNSDISVGYTW